jgi:hypothetical protein
MFLPLVSLRAEGPTTQPTGTISGKVVGEDGTTPQASVTVRILNAPLGKKAKSALQGKKNAPVATAVTGADGTFTVDVPAGSYIVTVGKKTDALVGREKVTVVEGQTATVTVTLKPPAPAKNK